MTTLEPNIKPHIEYTKSNNKLHAFELDMEDNRISYQVIKLKDSLYLWIGKKDKPLLVNMALAMNSSYETTPIATKLLGDEMESQSKNIACRLSKKLKKPVYVSFNIEESSFSIPIIERRLGEEMKKYPDKF